MTEEMNPWNLEPDEEQFSYKGFLCTVRRGTAGALCGYVGVGSEHKIFGYGYTNKIFNDIEVHGGLTFSNYDGVGIWNIGFDCGHSWDIVPTIISMQHDHGVSVEGATYKDIDFVISEIKHLADQLEKL